MNLWETYHQIDEHLKRKLFAIPPYPCISVNKVKKLLDCLENPDPAWGGLEGEILRMIINPWQRAYQIEYRFTPSKIFNGFIKVIESATYDLMIGNYACSYLSLVPVVEAVLREWADEQNKEIKSVNKDGDFKIFIFARNLVKYLKEQNNKRQFDSKFQKWISNQIKYFDFMIKKVFYLNFKDSEDGVIREFNRNRALHFVGGIDDWEVLRDNNIRIFLLLDIIAELYLCLDHELYTNNTFYSDCEDNLDFNLRWKIYLKNAMEAIDFTDMNIIKFAFFDEDENMSLSDEKKIHFIKQKDAQIQFINIRNKVKT